MTNCSSPSKQHVALTGVGPVSAEQRVMHLGLSLEVESQT